MNTRKLQDVLRENATLRAENAKLKAENERLKLDALRSNTKLLRLETSLEDSRLETEQFVSLLQRADVRVIRAIRKQGDLEKQVKSLKAEIRRLDEIARPLVVMEVLKKESAA
jgi:chromosome segregation ATPase